MRPCSYSSMAHTMPGSPAALLLQSPRQESWTAFSSNAGDWTEKALHVSRTSLKADTQTVLERYPALLPSPTDLLREKRPPDANQALSASQGEKLPARTHPGEHRRASFPQHSPGSSSQGKLPTGRQQMAASAKEQRQGWLEPQQCFPVSSAPLSARAQRR